jgi:hypothetical protein
MRNLENKPDEKLSSFTFWRNTPEYVHILTDRVVGVPKQWIVTSPALGICAFPGSSVARAARKWYWLNFLREKRREEPKVSFQWKTGPQSLISGNCYFCSKWDVREGSRITVNGFITLWEPRFILYDNMRKFSEFIISQSTQKFLKSLALQPLSIVRQSHLVKVQTRANDVNHLRSYYRVMTLECLYLSEYRVVHLNRSLPEIHSGRGRGAGGAGWGRS